MRNIYAQNETIIFIKLINLTKSTMSEYVYVLTDKKFEEVDKTLENNGIQKWGKYFLYNSSEGLINVVDAKTHLSEKNHWRIDEDIHIEIINLEKLRNKKVPNTLIQIQNYSAIQINEDGKKYWKENNNLVSTLTKLNPCKVYLDSGDWNPITDHHPPGRFDDELLDSLLKYK